jgi:hypothetical protein
MNTIFGTLIATAQFIGLIAVGAIVGLWWTPAFNHGNHNAEFLRATFFLFLFSIYFYKAVLKQKKHLPKFLFTFYFVLAFFAVCGYVLGFFVQ